MSTPQILKVEEARYNLPVTNLETDLNKAFAYYNPFV